MRHGSWNRPWVYEFLRENRIGFCNIDQPQVSYSIGATKRATGPVGYLRLHGRNAKAWFSESDGRDARYNYLYNETELSEVLERVLIIARQAEEIYVIANNHFRGQAVCNALEIKAMLGERKIKVPEALCRHYPSLKEILRGKELPLQTEWGKEQRI